MNALTVGLISGLLLGVAAAVGGWSGFLTTLVLGLLGAVVAGYLSGELDLSAMFRQRGRD